MAAADVTETGTGAVRSDDTTAIEFSRQGDGPVLVLVEPVGHFRQFSAFGGLAARLAVLDSKGSTEDLTGSAGQVSAPLPNAMHRSLPGQWHTVDDHLLATALIDFLDPSPSTHDGNGAVP